MAGCSDVCRRYPHCQDADVEIRLPNKAKDVLRVHSSFLMRVSPAYFRPSLSEPWVADKVTGTKIIRGETVSVKRYKLEYDSDLETWMPKADVSNDQQLDFSDEGANSKKGASGFSTRRKPTVTEQHCKVQSENKGPTKCRTDCTESDKTLYASVCYST